MKKVKRVKRYHVYCVELHGEREGFEFKTIKNALAFIEDVIKKFPELIITIEVSIQ